MSQRPFLSFGLISPTEVGKGERVSFFFALKHSGWFDKRQSPVNYGEMKGIRFTPEPLGWSDCPHALLLLHIGLILATPTGGRAARQSGGRDLQSAPFPLSSHILRLRNVPNVRLFKLAGCHGYPRCCRADHLTTRLYSLGVAAPGESPLAPAGRSNVSPVVSPCLLQAARRRLRDA